MSHHLTPDSTPAPAPADASGSELQGLLPWLLRLGKAAPSNDASPPPPHGGLVSLFEEAIAHDRRCALRYLAEDGAETVREVDPLAVSWRGDGPLLLAHCRLRDDLRSFRLERVVSATVLPSSRRVRPSLGIERFLQRRRTA